MKLTTMLHATAQRVPDKAALIYQDRSWTYTELVEQSLKAAAVIRAKGVGEGDVIGIMTHNVPGFVFAAFGAWHLGATVVPTNHKFQAPEVKYTVEHSGMKLGIATPELIDIARTGAPQIEWLETDSDNPEGFDALVAAAAPLSDSELPEFDDAAVAQILYTSGTTSAPKGCMHSHFNIAQVATLLSLNVGYRESDRLLLCMPIWHSAPLNVCLMPMILMGGTVILQREYHPVKTMSLIAEAQATVFFGPTVAYTAPIMAAEKMGFDFNDFDFSSVRIWTYGGAPIDKTSALKIREAYGSDQFFNLFGMSEMGPTGTMLRPEDLVRKAGSVGKAAMVGVEMRIVTADAQEAQPGESGEVWFKSDTRMLGYLNNPEATAAAFDGDWYKTGDIARLDEDGYLYIVDRKNDVIIVGGENVYSLEVEEVMITHPDIVDVAVVGRPDSDWGEQLVAFVTTAEGAALTADDVREYMSDKIARYKIPRELVLTEALPRNPSGKLLKHKLREMARENA